MIELNLDVTELEDIVKNVTTFTPLAENPKTPEKLYAKLADWARQHPLASKLIGDILSIPESERTLAGRPLAINALGERFSLLSLDKRARAKLKIATRKILARAPWTREECVIAFNQVRLAFAAHRVEKHPKFAWVALDILRHDLKLREFFDCIPKRTVITGASSGIGEALAYACAERGDRVYFCGRNAERVKAVAEKCGAKTTGVVLDVADKEATDKWLKGIAAEGTIDRVFANAGVAAGEEIEPNIRRAFAINVGGCVNTVLPAIELKAKHIIMTASIAGYGPLKSCPTYSATKACVKTWALGLRGYLAPKGIKVSVICPGFVRSRITDENTCPMPFFMEANEAAEIILDRVAKNTGLIAFPWQMRFATWILSILPYRLNEIINKFLPNKA